MQFLIHLRHIKKENKGSMYDKIQRTESSIKGQFNGIS
ncbi:hypothetical protein (plasmid) [Metabacillus dongyingensis]|nr:hypothetical protein [Metabacillus dongyingensis]